MKMMKINIVKLTMGLEKVTEEFVIPSGYQEFFYGVCNDFGE